MEKCVLSVKNERGNRVVEFCFEMKFFFYENAWFENKFSVIETS